MPEYFIPRSRLWTLIWRDKEYCLWKMRDFYQFTSGQTFLPPKHPVGSKNLQHLALLMGVELPETLR